MKLTAALLESVWFAMICCLMGFGLGVRGGLGVSSFPDYARNRGNCQTYRHTLPLSPWRGKGIESLIGLEKWHGKGNESPQKTPNLLNLNNKNFIPNLPIRLRATCYATKPNHTCHNPHMPPTTNPTGLRYATKHATTKHATTKHHLQSTCLISIRSTCLISIRYQG